MTSSTATSPSTHRTRRRAARPPLRVALTGGIASGKSTVSGLFAALGVPVVDTDQIARDVVQPGSPVLAGILRRFGPAVLQASGQLDRRALRRIIFADPAARADLEALIHPAIQAETQLRCSRARGPYLLVAVPLLAEKASHGRFDRVLVVDCDPALQLQRLMVRDHSTRDEAQAILDAQADRSARLAIADDVIRNEGDLKGLARQVEALHEAYLAHYARPEPPPDERGDPPRP